MRPIAFLDIANLDAEITPMDPILGKNGVGNLVMAKGVLTSLLGILHVLVGFTFEAGAIAKVATPELRRDYLVWFSGFGFFVVFLGLVDTLCAPPLKQGNPLAWRIASLSAAFTGLIGSAGVLLYGISPPLALMVMSIGWIVLAGLWQLDRRSA